MSWNASRQVEEIRSEFLARWADGKESVSDLCREYGISRKTAYKWKSRKEAGEALGDRSRRPKSAPCATSAEIVSQILALRGEHPTLGGAKIALMLRNKGFKDVPSGTTVTEILRRHGLLDKRAIAEATHMIRFTKSRPNEMWQMDFKGNFLMDDGTRCHPLNIVDDYSRYAITSTPLTHETFEAVKPCLVSAFQRCGVPESILCDNGTPWGVSQKKGITALETWAMERDVLVLHGRPLHPQTQGKEERFNKTWKREVLEKLGPRPNYYDILSESEIFRNFYNDERPHFGIGGKCPRELYGKSDRAYSETVLDWTYPSVCEVHYVNCKGYVSLDADLVYIGEGLCGKQIATRPSFTHPGCVDLLFRNFRIGRLNLSSRETEYLRVYRLEGDPREHRPDSTH